jgi:hypothetical protein
LDNPPPLSPHVAHLWAYYCDLAKTRTVGMAANRLTRLEIQAWERDEGVRLARWERRAIMAVDAEHLRIMAESSNKGG